MAMYIYQSENWTNFFREKVAKSIKSINLIKYNYLIKNLIEKVIFQQ